MGGFCFTWSMKEPKWGSTYFYSHCTKRKIVLQRFDNLPMSLTVLRSDGARIQIQAGFHLTTLGLRLFTRSLEMLHLCRSFTFQRQLIQWREFHLPVFSVPSKKEPKGLHWRLDSFKPKNFAIMGSYGMNSHSIFHITC